MNTITNNVVAKLTVAFVAAAMLFTLATPVKAVSVEELQAQIALLMEQIAELSGDATPAPAAGACTFTRSLSDGSEGADVTCLQDYLTPMYFNFAGGSTGYFGSVTTAAVAAWQAANGVAPAVGYFGPVSQAQYDMLMAAVPTPDPDMDDDSSDDSEDSEVTLQGEADLYSVEIDDAEDDEIDEGMDNAEVAEVTVEFRDGDAKISRIDITIDTAIAGVDPSDNFSEFSLWVDGDKVADMDASDDDEYLDEDDGSVRFSGLDIFAEEDEEVEIVIAVSVNNNVDSADQGTYRASIDAIRFFDGDDVSTTDSSTGDLGDPRGATVTFTVGEAGDDDELTVRTSSKDPVSTTFPVEDDSDSDWYTAFVFDLDTDDSENDIEINTLVLNVLTDGVTPADAGYDDLVDDVELVIDGVTIDDVTIGGTYLSEGIATLTFDVDGDVEIDAGDRVEVKLLLKFNSLPVAEEGATVKASISSLDTTIVDAEGADNLVNSQLGGSATGDLHTLRTEGLILTITDIQADEELRDTGSGDLDYGVYVFTFDVEAFEEDFYTDEDSDVINFTVYVDGVASTTPDVATTLRIDDTNEAATADEVLAEGQVAEYTFTVETGTGFAGAVEVVIDSIDYSAADDVTEELNVTANPVDDWTSNELILN